MTCEHDYDDALSAARGCVFGVLGGGAVWVVIGVLCYVFC